MKKLLAILLAMLITISMAGCAATRNNTGVQIVLMALDSDYWRNMKSGAEQAGKDLGVTVEVTAPAKETDVLDQINLINVAASKHPASLIVAPCDTDMVVDPLVKAMSSGVNTVLFDSDVSEANSSCRSVFVGISNYDAAYEAGLQLAKCLSDGDTVLIISKNPAATDHYAREHGFVDAVNTTRQGVNFVVKATDEDARTSAYSITSDFLATNKTAMVYCTASDIVSGAVEAIGDGNTLVAGFDVDSSTEGYLNTGKQLLCIDQDPYNIGYKAVKAAVEKDSGKDGVLYLPATMRWGYVK